MIKITGKSNSLCLYPNKMMYVNQKFKIKHHESVDRLFMAWYDNDVNGDETNLLR
ncbi:hypothetical protein QFZ77_000530 [Paenibacillus sp. V4I3]|nr:hypothetical protein [Paenibacillus sp. V4I3]MDQ0892246.1 hypothetical protein [Paenibacillus sp. V4I9]